MVNTCWDVPARSLLTQLQCPITNYMIYVHSTLPGSVLYVTSILFETSWRQGQEYAYFARYPTCVDSSKFLHDVMLPTFHFTFLPPSGSLLLSPLRYSWDKLDDLSETHIIANLFMYISVEAGFLCVAFAVWNSVAQADLELRAPPALSTC